MSLLVPHPHPAGLRAFRGLPATYHLFGAVPVALGVSVATALES